MNDHNQTSKPGQTRPSGPPYAKGHVPGAVQSGDNHPRARPTTGLPYPPAQGIPPPSNATNFQMNPHFPVHASRTGQLGPPNTVRVLGLGLQVDSDRFSQYNPWTVGPRLSPVAGFAQGLQTYQPMPNTAVYGPHEHTPAPPTAPQIPMMAMQAGRGRIGYGERYATQVPASAPGYPRPAAPFSTQGTQVMSRFPPRYHPQSGIVQHPQVAQGRLQSPDVAGPMRNTITPSPSRSMPMLQTAKVSQAASFPRPRYEPQTSISASSSTLTATAPRRTPASGSITAGGFRQAQVLSSSAPTAVSGPSGPSSATGEVSTTFTISAESHKDPSSSTVRATPTTPPTKNPSIKKLEALLPREVIAGYDRTDFIAVYKLALEHIAKGDALGLWMYRNIGVPFLRPLGMMIDAALKNEEMPEVLTHNPCKFTREALADYDYKSYLVTELVNRQADNLMAATAFAKGNPGSSTNVTKTRNVTQVNALASTSQPGERKHNDALASTTTDAAIKVPIAAKTVPSVTSSSTINSKLSTTTGWTMPSPLSTPDFLSSLLGSTAASDAPAHASTATVRTAKATPRTPVSASPRSDTQRPSLAASSSSSTGSLVSHHPSPRPRPRPATGPVIAIPSASGCPVAARHHIAHIAGPAGPSTATDPAVPCATVRPADLHMPILATVPTTPHTTAARANGAFRGLNPQQILQKLHSAPAAHVSVSPTSTAIPGAAWSPCPVKSRQTIHNSAPSTIALLPTRGYSELSNAFGCSFAPRSSETMAAVPLATNPRSPQNTTGPQPQNPVPAGSSKRKLDDSWMGESTLGDHDRSVAKKARTTPDVDKSCPELPSMTSTNGVSGDGPTISAWGGEDDLGEGGVAEQSGLSTGILQATDAEAARDIMALFADAPSTNSTPYPFLLPYRCNH